MRILLVEDDELLGKALETGLRQALYTPEWVKDGDSAVLAIETTDFSAIILDINLPNLSGLEVLKIARKSTRAHVPIIIMTARDGLQQRVEGLDLGADDYIAKPFDLEELYARIRALIRRSQGRADSKILCHDIELDSSARTVKKNGEWIKLAAKEYSVLAFLMERAGKIQSKSEIEEQLYGWEKDIDSNTIEVTVYALRKKLGRELITTIRGVGYMVNP